MQGGQITGNVADVAGGVYIQSGYGEGSGTLTMSGGKISMNVSAATLAHDVWLHAWGDYSAKIYLSGNAVIGNLVLSATPPS